MATIQKVSGIDFANISKFDAVLISAVGSINFIGKPATGTLLLDTPYGSGAEAAYSVRKLRTAYNGAAMQVQATTGGATAEIGFDVNGNLDTTTLLAYASGNEVGVSIWYDQSTNGNNAVQTTVAERPIVVAAGGALVEQKGKFALRMASNTIKLSVPNSKATFKFLHDGSSSSTSWVVSPTDARETVGTTQHELFETGEFTNSVGVEINYSSSQYSGTELAQFVVKNGTSILGSPVNYTTPARTFAIGQNLTTFYIDADNATAADRFKVGLNGGSLLSGNTQTAAPSAADSQLDFTIYGGFTAHWQEVIVWNADKSTYRTSIEENIADYYTQNQAPYLLDTYTGAAAAYSLRLLDSSYVGSAIRVRRSSDNTEQDIGFNVFGELDTVSLMAFVGASYGGVKIFYDQSGNGADATQTVIASQPLIVSAGTLITLSNGKPAVESFNASVSWGAIEANVTYAGSNLSAFAVYEYATGVNAWPLTVDDSFNSPDGVLIRINENELNAYRTSDSTKLLQTQNLNIGSNIWNGTNLTTTANGVSATPDTSSVGTTSFDFTTIQLVSAVGTPKYKTCEIILYTSDESANRTGIQTNINDFYDIYTVAPTPTPLLLNLYPNASAGYSLRKLNASYTGSAILVQNTVGGATKAIDFDINGNLNTAELIAYGGSNDVFVATWFDQSGNGNNATQATSANRPKIYDGASGAVIVDANGKPRISVEGTKNMTIGNLNLTEVNGFVLFEKTALGTYGALGTSQTTGHWGYIGGQIYDGFYNNARPLIAGSGTISANTPALLSMSHNGTMVYRVNAAEVYNQPGTFTNATTIVLKGYYDFKGYYQEIVLYPSVKSAPDTTGIESNIGGYYDIPLAGLLDTYSGAAAGYSLRRLSSTYTGFAIKVQDNVGGATLDVGFDSYGDLDTAAIVAYGGVNDVFVETWYDQSGSGNNATQATSANRPKIYDGASGAVITENGKPAVDFDGVSDALNSASNVSMPLNNTIAIVAQGTSTTTDEVFNINGTAGVNIRIQSAVYKLLYSDFDQNNITSATNNQFIIFAGRQSSSDTVHGSIDGGAQLADTSNPSSNWNTATAKIHIGARNGTSLQWDGKVQEVIYYESDELANRTGIEENIGGYYDIPLAGLLDEYSGAAAGYSLRRLSSTYTGFAIKVQDNVGGATLDVGFDSYGDLDTAAIAAYGGSNDVFVETWYDQSGNGNNATQATSANRPKIYDGTTGVVTENGKPAITQGSFLSSTFSTSISQPVSIYTTHVDLGTNFFHQGITNNLQLRGYVGKYQIFGDNGVQLFLTSPIRSALFNQQILLYNLYNGTGSKIAVNGATPYTGTIDTNGTSGFKINTQNITRQEFIIFEADDTNRTGIETNIGGYYYIPLAGLLDEYSGAAAGYSLRRLSSTYTGFAIKVQDNVGGATLDVGFDSYGDLDTAAIAAYGGSNDVFVETWYDQSGNGNNATQATSANRPKIYDGTTGAVVTNNGKPSLNFKAGDFMADTTWNGASTTYIFNVLQSNGLESSPRIGIDVGSFVEYYGLGINGNTGASSAGIGSLSQFSNGSSIGATRDAMWDAMQSQNVLTVSGDFSSWTGGFGLTRSSAVMYTFAQEFIIYNSDESANRTGIETNINDFYDIY